MAQDVIYPGEGSVCTLEKGEIHCFGVKCHINKIRNENGEITTDNTEIQRIVRDYYQQLYANNMDNLEEMDKFLEKYNFPN